MRGCFRDFGVDMNRSHEEIAAEYARLEHVMQHAPTLTARRKAAVQLRRLAEQLRLGGPSGGAMVERSRAAVGVNYEAAWEEARQAGRAARDAVPAGAWFPQGWATLVTSDKVFAKVLARLGAPDLFVSDRSLHKQKYLGGYGFGVRSRSHGLPEQEAFCNTVVNVLKQHGVNVWCHTAWD